MAKQFKGVHQRTGHHYGLSLQTGRPYRSKSLPVDPTQPQSFKIQRPLAGEMGDVLIYNKGRSLNFFLPYEDGMKELFRLDGDPLKIYVLGNLKPDPDVPGAHAFHVIDVLAQQGW